MNIRFKTYLLLIFGLSFTFQSCQNCDNCTVTPVPKQVKIVNSANKDLVFGSGAIYNPDDIELTNDLGNTVEFLANRDNGSLDFSFNVNSDMYFLKLNSKDTDTISFVYGKDKQVDCCNEFDVTASTKVNNTLTSNDDIIKIIK